MAEQRTIPPRDVNVLAAYKSFTPPAGNTHDVIFAAIRHGYDVGVGEADAENARLRTEKRDWQVACGVAANQRDALRAKVDAVGALIAPMWRPLDYDRNALIDDLRAILNGEEPK